MIRPQEDSILLHLVRMCLDIEKTDQLIGLLHPRIHWDYLVEKAEREGIASILCYHLTRLQVTDKIPPSRLRKLQEIYHTTIARNMVILDELKKILSVFKRDEIPYLLLKGVVFAELIYPGIGLRPMGDVDILVHKKDFFKVGRILEAMDYFPIDGKVEDVERMLMGYLTSLDYRRPDRPFISVHIHWHLINSSVPTYMFTPHVDLDRIWKSADKAVIAGSESLILSLHHSLIYLNEHALRVGHSFDRLILLIDIYQFLRVYGLQINWNLVIEESRAFNLDRMVYLGLYVTDKYFNTNVPKFVLQALRPKRLHFGEHLFLSLALKNSRHRGLSYGLYLAMNRGVKEKLKFVIKTLFPPSQVLKQRSYDLGSKNLSFYYLRRIGENWVYFLKNLSHFLQKARQKAD